MEKTLTLLSRLGYAPVKSDNPVKIITKITPNEISVIVPVKNNQAGIDRLLKIFTEVTQENDRPKEIIIVDNNSTHPVVINEPCALNVKLLRCSRQGPAAARNRGVTASIGNWLLFIDSDCIPTATTISGYRNRSDNCIGYAGNIKSTSSSLIGSYYESQEILIPPEAQYENTKRPDYLVTANCLVYRDAFEAIGGFDEAFEFAGGEDIDLAFRLLEVGELQYQFDSLVLHEFSDSLLDFAKRFVRYGSGNRQISDKYGLALTPKPFMPIKRVVSNYALSFAQYISMSFGYWVRR